MHSGKKSWLMSACLHIDRQKDKNDVDDKMFFNKEIFVWIQK
jgi:hypothetical protein